MKILLVDDHALFTDGLKSILEQSGLFEMVRSTNRATDAIRMLRNQAFDLVLLDVDMPDRSGPEVLRDIRSEFPTMPVIMVSMHMERGIIQQVRKDGASGYVLKNAGKEEFLVAIQKVAGGGMYFSSELMDRWMAREAEADPTQKGRAALSERELEIIRLLSEGLTSQEIADRLFLSVRTVETHRKSILDKLELKNVAGLIRYAFEHRLIT